MNKDLPPDERADLVLKEMTFDEKMQFVHGTGFGFGAPAGSPECSALAFPISTWRRGQTSRRAVW